MVARRAAVALVAAEAVGGRDPCRMGPMHLGEPGRWRATLSWGGPAMPPESPRRYCRRCGATFAVEGPAPRCGECGAHWTAPAEPGDVSGLASLLNRIEDWRDAGILVPSSYRLLRRRYEPRLEVLRASRAAGAAAARAAARPAAAAGAAAAPPARRRPVREAPQRPPPKPPRPPIDLTRWASEREADILLYLGAFLLVIAAVVFVNYQGDALSAEIRVAVLAIYTASFVTAGLLVRRWERVREAGPVFLLVGALFTPLNFVLLDVELLDRRGVPNDVMWLAGAGYSGLFYSILAARGYGRIYALPAVPALADRVGRAGVRREPARRVERRLVPGAHGRAQRRGRQPRLAGLGSRERAHDPRDRVHGERTPDRRVCRRARGPAPGRAGAADRLAGRPRRGEAPALAAAPGGQRGDGRGRRAALGRRSRRRVVRLPDPCNGRARGREPAALGALGSRRRHLRLGLRRGARAVAAGALLRDARGPAGHGAASHLAGAAVLAAIAWRNREGDVVRDVLETETRPAVLIERVLFAWTAFGLLLVAVALAQQRAGVERPDTGWAYLAIALAVGVALAALGRRHRWVPAALFPPFAAAVAVSLQPWESAAGHDAVLLGAPAVPLALAFATTRRYSLASAATVLAAAAAAAAWGALEWSTWTLAVAYGVSGAAALLGLTPLRRYASLAEAVWFERPPAADRDAWVLALSWGLSLAAPITAAVALAARIHSEPATVGVETVEYRALVFLALALAPLIAFEGWRLRNWHATALATTWAAVVAYAIWPAFDWPMWTLALTFMALGTARFALLTPLRRYARDTDLVQASVALLSWGPLLLGPATAAVALAQRLDGEDIAAAETVEYRVLAALILLLAPPILFEARRFREWSAAALAQAPIAVALALAWPVFEWPAWTLGVAYWAGGTALFLALTSRRRYGAGREQLGIFLLSWPLLAAGIAATLVGVAQRADAPLVEVDQTIDYAALAALTLLSVAHLAFEARRLRNWNVATGAGVLAGIGLGVAWPALDWPAWSLALAYAGLGGVLLVALTPYRHYAPQRQDPAVLSLSWGFLVLALLVAYRATADVAAELGDAVRSAEYYTLSALVLAAAAAVAYEGWRLRERRLLLGASALAMGSVLMAIAIARPENVQAYTAPSAAYLLVIGAIVRRSTSVIERHLSLHEVATIAGALTLVLPQAEQSFEPGGAWWGFVLLLESAAFVATAFLLRIRWLAVAGVLTASGVGIRWLAESGDTIPYWATLGVGGMLLIAAGTSLLLNREWWERTAQRTASWWEQSPLRA